MALPPVLDEENLYKFRTKICERYVKQGRCEFADKCQYSHDLRWTRRPPWKYTYSPELCKDLTFITDGRGRTVAKSNCKQKRNCKYSHTKEEQMYHPNVYKTAMCKHHLQEGWCDRYYCPFGHTEAELRHREEHLDINRIIPKDIEQESLCPDIYLPSDRPHPKLRARFLAIMDGLCSNAGESNGTKNPSVLQRRTRQPYSDFISSHTPHSIISDAVSPSHGEEKKLDITHDFHYPPIGISGKQSAIDRLKSTDAENSYDYKLNMHNQNVSFPKTNMTGKIKAPQHLKKEDIASLVTPFASADSTNTILNTLLMPEKRIISPTTQYPILDCILRNKPQSSDTIELSESLTRKFKEFSLDTSIKVYEKQKTDSMFSNKNHVCYLSQDVCYWNQPIGQCRDDPSVQVYAGLILGPEKQHEIVAIKQLPIVVASRMHLVWARIEKLLSLNDSLFVNMKRVFVVFGHHEGTSLWIVLNKCQGSIYDLVSRKGLSNSALQDPLPPAGITGMLSHIISAVLLLHQSTGLPHMRIHPGNIMITQQCEIKLGDCAGQVRYLSIVDLLHAGVQGAKNAKSLLEWILNTPSESCWMAPEFLKSLISLNEKLNALLAYIDMGSSNTEWDTLLSSLAEGYSWDDQFLKKADAWSVGATLFSLVCGGIHPYGDVGDAQTTLNALEDRKVNAALVESSPWLADLLYSLLAWDPKDRIELTHALCHPVFWQPYELEQYLEALRLTIQDQDIHTESHILSTALSYDIQWVDQLHRITSTLPLFSLLLSYISNTPYNNNKSTKYLASTYQQQYASSFFIFLSMISSDSNIPLYERRACITQSLLYHSPAFLHSIRLFLYPKVPSIATFNLSEKSYISCIISQHYNLKLYKTHPNEDAYLNTKPYSIKKHMKTQPPNKSYTFNIAEYYLVPPPPKVYSDLESLISQHQNINPLHTNAMNSNSMNSNSMNSNSINSNSINSNSLNINTMKTNTIKASHMNTSHTSSGIIHANMNSNNTNLNTTNLHNTNLNNTNLYNTNLNTINLNTTNINSHNTKKKKTIITATPPPPPPPLHKKSKDIIIEEKIYEKSHILKHKAQKANRKKTIKVDNTNKQLISQIPWENNTCKDIKDTTKEVTLPILYAYQKTSYDQETNTQNQTIEKTTHLPVMESTVSTAHSTTTQTENIQLINSQQTDNISHEERFDTSIENTKETITEQIKDLSPQTACAVQ